MAVIRVDKTNNYTVMANYHLRDKSLSLKAIGLMSFMLSLSDDWDYTVEGLSKCVKDGTDSIKATLKELEKAGYLVREQNRAGGKFSKMSYTLYEMPNKATVNENREAETPSAETPQTVKSSAEKPLAETPSAENPLAGKPLAEKQPQRNTNLRSTKERSTKERSTYERKGGKPPAFEPPTVEQVRAYCENRGNQVDPESFVDFYQSKGWLVGKTKMKDWQAAVRTWEKREKRKTRPWPKTNSKQEAISTVQRLAAKYAAKEGLG